MSEQRSVARVFIWILHICLASFVFLLRNACYWSRRTTALVASFTAVISPTCPSPSAIRSLECTSTKLQNVLRLFFPFRQISLPYYGSRHIFKKGINTHLVPKLFQKVQCGTRTLGMFNLVPQFSKEVQFGPLR